MTEPESRRQAQDIIQKRYDFIANWHDVLGALVTPHRPKAVRALDAQAGERILDLACGTGVTFKRIRARLSAAGTMIGLDYSDRPAV